MIQTRFPLLVRSASLMTMLMLAALPGCSSASPDATAALDALTDLHARLAGSAEQQAALCSDLAGTVAEIAAERLRLKLLLDLDELITPEGHADREMIERLLREGSDNVVVRQVRLGRTTLDEACQIVNDVALARDLSPELRAATEERLVELFGDWQQLAAARRVIADGLDQQRHATNQMIDEATQLTSAIREATSDRREPFIRVSTAAQGAAGFIPDPELRESVRALLDVLLTPADHNATARNHDQ